MLIFYAPDLLKEEGEIIGFGKARELRGIMQTNIINLDASRDKAIKKPFASVLVNTMHLPRFHYCTGSRL